MTNQQGAPEALRLAAEVLDWMPTSDTQRALWDRHQKALVVVKAALVEAQQPATHVQNPAEIEHVTGDVSKNGAEVNMSTQQPAPAGATQDDGIAARRAKYLRNDTDAGRAYVAQYLRSMGQHYFDDYIQTDLAGDFACALAASLSLSTPQPAPATQQAGATKEHLRIVRVIADKIEDGTLFQSGIYSNKDLARFVRNVADAAAPQFPTAQPAPATQQPCPTCAALARTVMLDQVSFDRKPDCYGIRQITDDEGVEEWEDIRTSPDVAREEANDMMATGRGEIYEVVPLWTTPQPSPTPQADSAPSAAAPVGEAPLPLLVRDIAADLGTTPIQVCTALAQLGFGGHSVNMAVTPRMAKSLRAHFASTTPQADSAPRPRQLLAQADPVSGSLVGYFSDEAPPFATRPTPQADSQPAPQGETNAQLDIDSNSSAPGQQRDVAGSVALGQPVGNGSDQAAGHTGAQGDKLLIVAERNIRSFLRSAVFKSESDREAALNCVDVLWEAARAPADSVTAPAGGVDDAVDAIALARYKVVPAHESMFHRFAVVAGDGKQQLYLGREIECANMARKFAGAFLDGAFYQANIAPTPPAQAADSVLEDADPLQGAANWLAEAHGQFCVAVLQGCLMIGYNRAKRLHDAAIAARKQGGA